MNDRAAVRSAQAEFADLPDDELMRRIVARDQRAFRILTDRYMKMLFSAAYRLGTTKEEAEDIVQEAMVRLWQKAESWNPEKGAAVRTWLYRIAYNLAVDLRRKDKPNVVLDNLPLESEDASDRATSEAETGEIVRAAIEKLPERQKTALVLSHYEELGNAEVAEIMNTTVKGIEGLLVRARKTLREALTKHRAAL